MVVDNFSFYITPQEYQQAQENGVRPRLLDQRVRMLGWKKIRAIQTPPKPQKSVKQWVEVGEQNGIKSATVRNRINKLGWEPERAATEPLRDKKKAMLEARKRRWIKCSK
ncbi:MAG: hypothetical protein Q8911_08565 [Bacillota bacterium]|nr:hypothetical protein [Bacillota bacterium]